MPKSLLKLMKSGYYEKLDESIKSALWIHERTVSRQGFDIDF
jgi:hypothetical protein